MCVSMDTTFRSPAVAWRAIDDPRVWTLGYWAIIAGEALTGLLFAIRRHADARRVAARRPRSSTGRRRWCTWRRPAGFLVWFLGFVTIGGEWFLMWQSETWNGQEAGLPLLRHDPLVLIYVTRDDAELG